MGIGRCVACVGAILSQAVGRILKHVNNDTTSRDQRLDCFSSRVDCGQRDAARFGGCILGPYALSDTVYTCLVAIPKFHQLRRNRRDECKRLP